MHPYRRRRRGVPVSPSHKNIGYATLALTIDSDSTPDDDASLPSLFSHVSSSRPPSSASPSLASLSLAAWPTPSPPPPPGPPSPLAPSPRLPPRPRATIPPPRVHPRPHRASLSRRSAVVVPSSSPSPSNSSSNPSSSSTPSLRRPAHRARRVHRRVLRDVSARASATSRARGNEGATVATALLDVPTMDPLARADDASLARRRSHPLVTMIACDHVARARRERRSNEGRARDGCGSSKPSMTTGTRRERPRGARAIDAVVGVIYGVFSSDGGVECVTCAETCAVRDDRWAAGGCSIGTPPRRERWPAQTRDDLRVVGWHRAIEGECDACGDAEDARAHDALTAWVANAPDGTPRGGTGRVGVSRCASARRATRG